MAENKSILLDFYDGAYGPTLRIDIDSWDDLERLKRALSDLAHGVLQQVSLLQLDGVDASSRIRRAILLHDASVRPAEKTLRVTQFEDGVEIFWSGPAAYWSRCAGLIDGLISVNRAAHQYLTNETVDDALVEVAFMERVAPAIPEAPIHR